MKKETTKKEPRRKRVTNKAKPIKSLEDLGDAIILQETKEVIPVIRMVNQPERNRVKNIKNGLKIFR